MKNKNIILALGVLALLGTAYYFMKKNKAKKPYKIKTSDSATVYVIKDGKRYSFPNPTAYLNFGILEVKVIPKSELDLIPNGNDIDDSGKITGELGATFDASNFTVKSKEEPSIYLVKNGKKHLIKNSASHLNYLWSEITVVTKDELDLIPDAGGVDNSGNLIVKKTV
jgi:hypothetical protein